MRAVTAMLLIVSGLFGMGAGEGDVDPQAVADAIEVGGDTDGDGDGELDFGDAMALVEEGEREVRAVQASTRGALPKGREV